MKPFDLFVTLSILGTTFVSLMAFLTDCSQPDLVTVDAVVVDKTERVVDKEVTVLQPSCPSCPGSPPKEKIEVVKEKHWFVTASPREGKGGAWTIEVSAEVHAALSIGDPVQVELARGTRLGRQCRPPKLVLGP